MATGLITLAPARMRVAGRAFQVEPLLVSDKVQKSENRGRCGRLDEEQDAPQVGAGWHR